MSRRERSSHLIPCPEKSAGSEARRLPSGPPSRVPAPPRNRGPALLRLPFPRQRRSSPSRLSFQRREGWRPPSWCLRSGLSALAPARRAWLRGRCQSHPPAAGRLCPPGAARRERPSLVAAPRASNLIRPAASAARPWGSGSLLRPQTWALPAGDRPTSWIRGSASSSALSPAVPTCPLSLRVV